MKQVMPIFFSNLAAGVSSVDIPVTASVPKPLTKSRFKIALECPTRLYYEARPRDYFNANQDNDFLQSLADGGNQVGELAKYLYHPDPVGAGITVESLDYEEAVLETHRRMQSPERTVIAEAAIRYAEFFIRIDVLIHDPQAMTLHLIEVKSSSVKADDIARGFKNKSGEVDRKWQPYLYDIAFQAQVAKLAFPGYRVEPRLVLLDSEVACDVDGLHQRFRVIDEVDPDTGRSRARIETAAGTTRESLGSLGLLREVDVSGIVAELSARQVSMPFIPPEAQGGLLSFMTWASGLQQSRERWFGGVSKACKGCPYRAAESDPQRSGVHECWQMAIEQGQLDGGSGHLDRSAPLSIDLWGGAAGPISVAQTVIDARRALVADVQDADLQARRKDPEGEPGMLARERRLAQVRAVAGTGAAVVLNEEALGAMDGWTWPLHMIDFETSAPALPFFKGMHPYETLAFQFSHHVMDKDANGKLRIGHANQWICTAATQFPSIEFVRRLRTALMPDGSLRGTVFRYHFHENTVLRKLRDLIQSSAPRAISDADELISFIDLITSISKTAGHDAYQGERSMVDLHRLVRLGYYSRHAGGSNSLKRILPAILNDAPGLAALYSRPGIYGKGLAIPSLNFDAPDGHVWLDSSYASDPYKTLPPIFGPGHGKLNEMLARLAGDDEDGADPDGAINQGGLAMTAYNYTQFSDLSDQERRSIEQALLRYCELDTLAMVMLVQGLMELRGRAFDVAEG